MACLAVSLCAAAAAAMLELDEYLHRADASRQRGDWQSVANQLAQALNHPDLPGEGALRGSVHLEYGRAIGVLCQYTEAEKYLQMAADIARRSRKSGFDALYELAAISAARGNFAKAAAYLEQVLPMLQAPPAPPPQRVADVHDRLATALEAIGKPQEAESQRRQAARIRAGLPGGAAAKAGTPYGERCPKS